MQAKNNCSALRHSCVLLPYYLAPIDIPYLITHQFLPRNYGYVIRREAIIRRYLLASITYLYQFIIILSRNIFQKSDNFLPILSAGPKETGPKGYSGRIEGVYCSDYVFLKKAPANRKKRKKGAFRDNLQGLEYKAIGKRFCGPGLIRWREQTKEAELNQPGPGLFHFHDRRHFLISRYLLLIPVLKNPVY